MKLFLAVIFVLSVFCYMQGNQRVNSAITLTSAATPSEDIPANATEASVSEPEDLRTLYHLGGPHDGVSKK